MDIATGSPCITGLWVSLPVCCVLVLWSAGSERSRKDHHFQNAHWGHSANVRWSLSQWIQVSLENVYLCRYVFVCVCVEGGWGGLCWCAIESVLVWVCLCVCVCWGVCESVSVSVVYVYVSSVSILFFAHHSHVCRSVCVCVCVLVWECVSVRVCLCMVIFVCASVYGHVCARVYVRVCCVSVRIFFLPTTQPWQHPLCTPPPCLQTSAAGEHCYPFQLLPGSWPPSDSPLPLCSCCLGKWIPFVLLVCWERMFSLNV